MYIYIYIYKEIDSRKHWTENLISLISVAQIGFDISAKWGRTGFHCRNGSDHALKLRSIKSSREGGGARLIARVPHAQLVPEGYGARLVAGACHLYALFLLRCASRS